MLVVMVRSLISSTAVALFLVMMPLVMIIVALLISFGCEFS